MINDLKDFIAINSVASEPTDGAPFGSEIKRAFDLFLEKAKSYGLRVGSDDGYAVWCEYGEGEKLIGALAHVDVVPVGNGWATDPFTLTIEDGKMYGRGVSDDKGPMVAVLHAMKRLAEEKADLGCRVRLIVGGNEENGSSCIKHYCQNNEIPSISFTPDSDFPVVASEKGIAHVKLSLPVKADVTALGGYRANVVPDYAEVDFIETSPFLENISSKCEYPSDLLRIKNVATKLAEDGCAIDDFSFIRDNKGWKISAKGVSAHGSTPEKGDNAIRKILSLMAGLTLDEGWSKASALARPDASKILGIDKQDASGRLTINVGMMSCENEVLSLTVDFRLPASVTFDEIKSVLTEFLPTGSTIDLLHLSSPLFFDEEDILVKTLLSVYAKCTGDYKSKPLHIGGGTYAKELPNCVGFGAVFPNVDTHMHEADENYPVADFYKLENIYYQAIKALSKIVIK
ncbi:MAG: Sapep family Mn(2+)-dependent dipeptidase [Clostridia bacterium]|nr:Sapep family Mn(2+)-dependent dipeptidase [Clostridia bacterium]